MQYLPPSPARRNQECDFHSAGICFPLCVLGGISRVWSVSSSSVGHLCVQALGLARAECSVPPSLHAQQDPELPGSLYPAQQHSSLCPHSCSGAAAAPSSCSLCLWRHPGLCGEFQVSIPLKALHPGRNILTGERLQDSPYVLQRRFV